MVHQGVHLTDSKVLAAMIIEYGQEKQEKRLTQYRIEGIYNDVKGRHRISDKRSIKEITRTLVKLRTVLAVLKYQWSLKSVGLQ